jgi:hypothetical protein
MKDNKFYTKVRRPIKYSWDAPRQPLVPLPLVSAVLDEIGNTELARKDLTTRKERRLATEKREEEELYFELGNRLMRMQSEDSLVDVEEEGSLTIDFLPPTDLSWVKYFRQFTIYRDELWIETLVINI